MVESVAWITEMKNTESGLFLLLSILFFTGEVRTRRLAAHDAGRWRHRDYALTLVFGTLAIACKSTTAILPVILCLCAWWLDGQWQWRNLTTAIPVFLVSIAASAVSIRSSALSVAAWIASTPGAAIPNARWLRSWPQRLIAAGDAPWFYLWKLLWPHPLMAIYPRWKIDAGKWFLYLPLLAVLIVLSVFWAKRQLWARPYFFALAWFLIALLPLLGIFDNYIFHYSMVFDHFQYLASMAPLALAAVGMIRLSDSAVPGLAIETRLRMKPAAGAAVLLVLGLLSWQRTWAYQSEETLFADAVAKNPECWICDTALANALLEKGQVDGAIVQFQRALEINPDRPEDQNNLGVALVRNGRLDEAVEHYNAALRINPNYAKAHNGLAFVLLQTGKPDDAIEHLRKAVEIDPGHAEGLNSLGMALVQRGRKAEAMEEFNRALKINPRFAEAHYNLGDALVQAGRTDEAIVHLQEAVEINPNYAEAHNDLGTCLAQKGRLNEAIVQFNTALQVNPYYRSAQENLARAQGVAWRPPANQ
jgi:tetratricopeptide (TPR) repeat protein